MVSSKRTMAAVAAGGLAIAGLSVATGGVAGAQQVPAGAPQAPVCQGADLSVGKGDTQAGMHHIGMNIVVTNASQRACSMNGYPRVVLLDEHRKPVHTDDVYGSTYFQDDPGAHRIVLKPGQSSTSNVAYVRPTAPSDPQVTASNLQIRTPGAEDGEFVLPIYKSQFYNNQVVATALAR